MDRHGSVAWLKALSLIIVLGMGLAARADNWPQFRGPKRNGISEETGWLTRWLETGLKTLWKQTVGRGYSSVAVAGGRVFTLGLLPRDAEKKGALEETVICLDEATGKILWRFAIPGAVEKLYAGSRSTPTVDGKVLYVYGQDGGLFCLESETGKVVWQKSMLKDLGAQRVTYGYAASPLIVGDLVIVPARIPENKAPKEAAVQPKSNALLLAFSKKNGDEVWRVYHESFHLGGGYYACPTACVLNEQPCLVYHTGNACLGLEPTTGKILWKYSFSDADLKRKAGRNGITAQEPVVLGNRIVCCVHPDNSNGLGVCLDVEGDRVKEVWRDKLLDNYSCSYILWKGHVFGITHNDTASQIGPLYCFDVLSGFTGDGLILIEASTEEYRELARSQKLFRPEENSARYSDRIAPVLSNGRIYCRSQSGTLVCLDVRGK